MTHDVFEGPAIVIGYAYRLQIEAEAPIFEDGAYASHVRSEVTSRDVLANLSTANGGLVRISDVVLEINIPASATGQMAQGSVMLDVVRTDVTPDQQMSFVLTIPVVPAITRGLP